MDISHLLERPLGELTLADLGEILFKAADFWEANYPGQQMPDEAIRSICQRRPRKSGKGGNS